MEEQIVNGLSGKRIALAGLSGEAASALADAFDKVQAFCRVVDIDKVDPQSSLGVYDLVVFELGELPADHAWLQPEQLEALREPLLVIGPLSALSGQLSWIQEYAADFLTSPANSDEVVLRAYHVLSKAAKSAAAGRPAPSGPSSVVIADDDATTIALVKAVLVRNNLDCHVARDGGEALRLIGEVLPQAAVLDVNMPHLDGFEVLAGVRNDPRTSHIPVILLTSRQQEADIIRAFNLGASDYMVKPFSPMELVARLRRLVRSQNV